MRRIIAWQLTCCRCIVTLSRLYSATQSAATISGITHKPTGATYTPLPGSPFSGTLNKSQLGNMSKSGDEYRPHEVEEMMEQLWAEYVEANPQEFPSAD